MATFDYSPIAQYVVLTYKCPHCGEMTTSDAFPIPSPNFQAEKAIDSENYDDYEAVCEHCGGACQVNLHTRYDGGWGDIEEVNESTLDVEEEFDVDDKDYEEMYLKEFEDTRNEYERILDKLTILTPEEQNTINQLLYVNIIARMEAFLSDTLKREVLKDDASLRNFTEKYKDFETISLNLSDIYRNLDNHNQYVRSHLSDLIYHNLPKIKPIYRDVLGVDLGNIGALMKAILKRHDIVHRNGKDKDGNPLTITRQDITTLWSHVDSLTRSVNAQLLPTC